MEDVKQFINKCVVNTILIFGVSVFILSVVVGYCTDKILEAIEDQPTYVEQTQPPVEDDILCYDYATGHVYSAFVRDDGNVQLRINPEGNLVIAKLIEHEMPTEVREE